MERCLRAERDAVCSGIDPRETAGQVPQIGVEVITVDVPTKVSAYYVHLCIWYCDIMLYSAMFSCLVIFSFFILGRAVRLSWLNCHLSSAR